MLDECEGHGRPSTILGYSRSGNFARQRSTQRVHLPYRQGREGDGATFSSYTILHQPEDYHYKVDSERAQKGSLLSEQVSCVYLLRR